MQLRIAGRTIPARYPLIVAVFAVSLLVSILPVYGATLMTPVFGPQQYSRDTGPPDVFSSSFQHCGTQSCRIVVVNGNVRGKNRISSASITLNGVRLFGPRDFNQKVATLVKPVVLADQNKLKVKLASKPGSFITVNVQCAASPVSLSLGMPGISSTDPTTLLSSVDIVNSGTAAAQNVQATAITLPGATLTSPASLPFALGTISAGGAKVLQSDFSGAFPPKMVFPLTVKGTYEVNQATYCFSLDTGILTPPAAPGSANLNSVTVDSHTATGPFPPYDAETESEANPGGPAVPTGPFVAGTPTFTRTEAVAAPFGDPPAIAFHANNAMGLATGGTGKVISGPVEPSGAVTAGGVIFVTANLTAAFSTDGVHFTQLDPTTIFPADAIGFCCDQIVQYAPSIDRFIWLLQGATPGGYRIAVAKPADIIKYSGGTQAWTWWNLTPQVFGQPNGTGFDYPDMSLGNGFVYISWDAGAFCPAACGYSDPCGPSFPPPNCNKKPTCSAGCVANYVQGFQVARISLAGLAAGGTVTVGFTDPANGPSGITWGDHVSQDTGDEVFWAGHNGNSKLRVFNLPEASNTYSWRDISISSWANNSPTSLTPDNKDWLAKNFNCASGGGCFPRNGIIGATRSNSDLWLAWSAGTDSNFSQPHVELVDLDISNNFKKTQQVQIWNDSYAFAYPALATNACTGEVGLSFEYGGGGKYYENHVVGFWGDYVAYITTGSTAGSTRYGDYVTIRQAPATDADPGNLFAAFGFEVPSDIHYVLFGRPATSCGPSIK